MSSLVLSVSLSPVLFQCMKSMKREREKGEECFKLLRYGIKLNRFVNLSFINVVVVVSAFSALPFCTVVSTSPP